MSEKKDIEYVKQIFLHLKSNIILSDITEINNLINKNLDYIEENLNHIKLKFTYTEAGLPILKTIDKFSSDILNQCIILENIINKYNTLVAKDVNFYNLWESSLNVLQDVYKQLLINITEIYKENFLDKSYVHNEEHFNTQTIKYFLRKTVNTSNYIRDYIDAAKMETLIRHTTNNLDDFTVDILYTNLVPIKFSDDFQLLIGSKNNGIKNIKKYATLNNVCVVYITVTTNLLYTINNLFTKHKIFNFTGLSKNILEITKTNIDINKVGLSKAETDVISYKIEIINKSANDTIYIRNNSDTIYEVYGYLNNINANNFTSNSAYFTENNNKNAIYYNNIFNKKLSKSIGEYKNFEPIKSDANKNINFIITEIVEKIKPITKETKVKEKIINIINNDLLKIITESVVGTNYVGTNMVGNKLADTSVDIYKEVLLTIKYMVPNISKDIINFVENTMELDKIDKNLYNDYEYQNKIISVFTEQFHKLFTRILKKSTNIYEAINLKLSILS